MKTQLVKIESSLETAANLTGKKLGYLVLGIAVIVSALVIVANVVFK